MYKIHMNIAPSKNFKICFWDKEIENKIKFATYRD